jgi:tetratricopeptide (TPR) repeat protein
MEQLALAALPQDNDSEDDVLDEEEKGEEDHEESDVQEPDIRSKLSSMEASQILEKTTEMRGVYHPNTLNDLSKLALALKDENRLTEAEDMYRRLVDLRTMALGTKHPDTVTSMQNLAFVLREEQKYDEAEVTYREVLDRGGNDVDNKILNKLRSQNMYYLARMLQRQGKLEEAQQRYLQAIALLEESGEEPSFAYVEKDTWFLNLQKQVRYGG